jgi:hypothetical protein
MVIAIFLVSRLHPPHLPSFPWEKPIAKRIGVFIVVMIAGCALNPSFIYPSAAASQFIMLLLPFTLFFAMLRFPFRLADITAFRGMLRFLIILEIGIGLVQAAGRMASGGSSELVHGTFPGNAEQYAVFLIIAMFYFLANLMLQPRRKGFYLTMIAALLFLNLSIDNKASWFGLVISLSVVIWTLRGYRASFKHLFAFASLIAVSAATLYFIVPLFSTSLHRFGRVAEAVREDQLLRLGKIKAYVDIARSHLTRPHMLLVGSGASTFYSRACRQFYYSPTARAKMFDNPQMLNADEDPGERQASDSAGGLIVASTHTPYYDQFYTKGETIFAIGTIQVDQPYSPYAGLLGETGILGFFLYLSLYVLMFKQLSSWILAFRDDPIAFPLVLPTFGLFVYVLANSVYGPFLETTRVTTTLWTMIGFVCAYARMARQWNESTDPSDATENLPDTDADSVRHAI